MKKITLLLSLLITSVGFSQEVLQDFESGGPRDPFGGASFSLVADPDTGGSRGQVALLTASASGEFFQGINIDLTKNVELTSNKTMTMDVFSNSPITIAPKVVSGIDGAPDSTTSATHTGSGWETLSFTYDKGYDNTTTANGVYRVLVIYYLWKADNTGFINPAIDRVFYVDNISGIGVEPVADPVPTVAAPTPPNRPAADVISLYSNQYDNTTVETWNAAFDDSTSEDILIEGNDTKKISFTNFLGAEFLNNRIDASGMTKFHIDFWTGNSNLDGKVFNTKFSQWGTTNGEVSAMELNLESVPLSGGRPAIATGSWVSVDVDITTPPFSNNLTRDGFAQLIFSSNLGVVYIDNVYFHKGTTASVDQVDGTFFKVYPNPSQDVWNIESVASAISSIAVYDITGKLVKEQKESSLSATIDGSALSQGLYIAKISSVDGEVRSIKLSKN
ncbi:T9SS type A sorting domain-containing protein [Nonlabens sp. YIK11]|uniref:T9SS type A sorting domain-containing protein n=1 Tax=Nonlabens sp. YIK11 TaxID=1453349 RepID=UPI0006DC4A0D|nr:T9SS type A sorting domain-containing protein [Nonlabens sp. YIK11]